MECYSCGLTGHFKGPTACKPAGDKAKTRRGRALNQMEEGSDGDSIGQVSEEFIWATGIPAKMEANQLIDSGVYRTSLTEKQGKQTQPEEASRRPELKKSMDKGVPNGTKETLELLGRSRWQIQAGAGGEETSMIDVIKEAKESLLVVRDREALGIRKIQPEGNTLNKITKEADLLLGAEIRRTDPGAG